MLNLPPNLKKKEIEISSKELTKKWYKSMPHTDWHMLGSGWIAHQSCLRNSPMNSIQFAVTRPCLVVNCFGCYTAKCRFRTFFNNICCKNVDKIRKTNTLLWKSMKMCTCTCVHVYADIHAFKNTHTHIHMHLGRNEGKGTKLLQYLTMVLRENLQRMVWQHYLSLNYWLLKIQRKRIEITSTHSHKVL